MIAELQRTLAEQEMRAKAEKERLERTMADLQRAVAEQKLQNQAFLASTSWRLTAPLRGAITRLRAPAAFQFGSDWKIPVANLPSSWWLSHTDLASLFSRKCMSGAGAGVKQAMTRSWHGPASTMGMRLWCSPKCMTVRR